MSRLVTVCNSSKLNERPMTDEELRKHTKTEPYRLERRDGKQLFVTGTAGKDEIPFRREETTEKK